MISGKLREFNSSVETSKKLDESAINGLENVLNGSIPSPDNLNNLKSILEWPPSKYYSSFYNFVCQLKVYQTLMSQSKKER